jgi:hypothetical protein
MADELVFEVKKDNPNGSFDALSGSTISSRAYANAVETAYAGYLMYKGLLLPEKAEAVKGPEVAVSGAIATEEYISTETETSEGVDAVVDLPADESVEPTVEQTEESVVEGEAVANEQDNDENMESINETIAEPEAQKGDVNE